MRLFSIDLLCWRVEPEDGVLKILVQVHEGFATSIAVQRERETGALLSMELTIEQSLCILICEIAVEGDERAIVKAWQGRLLCTSRLIRKA